MANKRLNDIRLIPLIAAAALIAAALPAQAAEKKSFRVAGTFVEGCSCTAPCPCELVGLEHGCQGVGGFAFTSGSYDGVKLAGLKLAHAGAPGDWIRLYIDARNPRQRKAGEEFARAAFSAFGKIDAVRDARISISNQANKYTLTVDDGKILRLTTEPILGGDNRTPLVYSNIHNPLHPSVMQGKTVSCTYQDGDRSFKLEGSNAYFQDRLRSRGTV
ncbi:MAG: DUF1326 domain-containing protein [Candidatus Hydrogenedentes bacterium]|nr:DUF1326 domain-containing protein [Candidatus Hydrogenedentota bacterium]